MSEVLHIVENNLLEDTFEDAYVEEVYEDLDFN